LLYERGIDDSLPAISAATLDFSPDGSRIAIAFQETPTVFVWDVRAGRVSGQLHGHSGMSHTVQFSADSSRLYTGGYDGTVREWSLQSYSQLRRID